VEARRVESQGSALFIRALEGLDLQTAVFDIPDVDGLVLGAGGDQLLAGAYIQTSNLFTMELADKVVENKLFNGVLLVHAKVLDFEVAVDDLALLSEDVNASFVGVNDHSLDLVIAVVSDHRLLDGHLDDSRISDPG